MWRWWLVRVAAAIVAVWGLAASGLDLWGQSVEPEGSYAYVVVAGAGVMPDGAPGDSLRVRSERAIELMKGGAAPKLAFTGGVGDWGRAEAVVGADLAVTAGIPDHLIVREDRSTSTEENAIELFALIGDQRIVVVTDTYHVLRCQRVFGRYFQDVDVVGAVPPVGARGRGALREVLAVVWYTVRGRM